MKSTDIQKAYIGSTEVEKIYMGSDLIYQSAIDYSKRYFTLEALETGTFSFKEAGTGDPLQYSLDNGTTWTSIVSQTSTPTVNAGQSIIWKGTRRAISHVNKGGIGTFSSTGEFNVSGNILSLAYGDSFDDKFDLTGLNYIFEDLLHSNSKLISAINLVLQATTLTRGCYKGMFYNCANLQYAPVLPAITLAQECYWYGFSLCTSLTYLKCLAINLTGSNCVNNWLLNASSTGTFVKNPSMNSWPRNVSGIPSGWTVIDAS